jgi:hypothetical protein
MASAHDVRITDTPKGVRVRLGDLYIYPDGHANLTFRAVPGVGADQLNLPLTNAVDVLAELTTLVKRMNDKVVKKRPASS